MKTKLRFLFIGLALLAGVHPALAQPSLGILPTNNQSLLYWPATPTDYVLQSSTNLASTNWVFATDAVPASYGSQTAVTVSNASAARFFRLISVPPTADGMALIPAGEFTIGDTLDGDSDAIPTNVYVSAFYMDVNLVSSNQWAGVHSYATNHGYSFVHPGLAKAANNPVQTVDWYDAVKWCNARSQQTGLNPVYYTDAGFAQVYTNGEVDAVYVNWTNSGYRLPTEAEWEKAARGGLNGQRFPWGNTISESRANYLGNTATNYDFGPNGFNSIGSIGGTSPATSPVGSFPANGYGLNDMAGNVSELCWDWYAAPTYPAGSPYLGGTDPRGPVGPLSFRVLRGGNWKVNAFNARCACRNKYGLIPSNAGNYVGFRCARGF